MSDTITATGTESKFRPHPVGQFVGQCVDVINLGPKVQDYPGTVPYLAPACALVYRTEEVNDDTGEPIDVAREFTVSMGEKANLRKYLEQWRGKPYNAEQLKEGVPLHKLTGQYALLTIVNRESKAGRDYAVISACVGVPKQMHGATTDFQGEYVRAPYWETRKAEYATAASAFRAASSSPAVEQNDIPSAPSDADEMPF